jgi:catechol 2,3-dioxygenase-like lactoylglutathione lyase family enzyme
MPVSHVGLTVSNLASAQKFYQAALKPLGYRVTREERDQVAFGVTDPDFFICQDPSRFVFHTANGASY